MPQAVMLSEQKGLPRVLRLCFKRERAKSKTSCFMGRCSVSASHITQGCRRRRSVGDSFPRIENSGAGGTGTAVVAHMERHHESPI